MSTTVAIAGYSLPLNEEDQTEKRLMEISKMLGFSWNEMSEWEDILYEKRKYHFRWKPFMDINNKYGLIYITHYEYDASDIYFHSNLPNISKAMHDYLEQTNIIPNIGVNIFALLYYNGSDCPLQFEINEEK